MHLNELKALTPNQEKSPISLMHFWSTSDQTPERKVGCPTSVGLSLETMTYAADY